MTLWPTGLQEEEANEIEIGNLHESGGRILVSTLLAVIVAAAAGAKCSCVSSAEARKAIQAGYAEWLKRVRLDMNTIERMLALDFSVKLPNENIRGRVYRYHAGLKITDMTPACSRSNPEATTGR